MKKNHFVLSAMVLSLGTFVAKILGALYRVPLTNLLGSYGLGLYQMVFPVYSVLLDFSGAGAPSAISKLISSLDENQRETKAKIILTKSLKFFLVLGLLGSFFMLIMSGIISKGQGDENAYLGYILLSPAIFFVCGMSCFRGYFQGFMNMTPTAVSQIIEQVIKISLGLIFVRLLLPSINYAVGGATLAITVSEIVAFVFLFSCYKISLRKTKENVRVKTEEKGIIKQILRYLIPITLIGVLIPISQVIDSFIIVNALKNYSQNSTKLYGLFSGVASTVINLPVSICYGVATATIPLISKQKSEKNKHKSIKKSIFLTLILSVPSAIICYIFSFNIINILFKNLALEDKVISANLIKIMSIGVIFLSMLQSTNAILIGLNKQFYPILSMGIGVVLKIILEFVLIFNPKINIYGAGIALIACYFVANLLNLIRIFTLRNKNEEKRN